MKKLLLFVFLIGSLKSFAQTDYPDLLAMFVDEKYEKCLYKAEKYTLNEKTKKDPLPYLFMSRCYFEMSKRIVTSTLQNMLPKTKTKHSTQNTKIISLNYAIQR
ncbi:MAG: hypothetical protein RI989_881 [Bacteroidota bacterium]